MRKKKLICWKRESSIENCDLFVGLYVGMGWFVRIKNTQGYGLESGLHKNSTEYAGHVLSYVSLWRDGAKVPCNGFFHARSRGAFVLGHEGLDGPVCMLHNEL